MKIIVDGLLQMYTFSFKSFVTIIIEVERNIHRERHLFFFQTILTAQ